MARFNTNTQAAAQANDDWKAQAFLNVWLPTKAGGRRKVGAIPLKISRASDAQLIDFLSGGEEALRSLVNKLEFDFQLSGGNPENAFDL